MTRPNRRDLLVSGLTAAGAIALATSDSAVSAAAGTAHPALGRRPRLANPFTLGVASGDPLPDSVVLWTRLAPDPTAAGGLGGMPNQNTTVEWELATDQRFTKVAARGSTVTRPVIGHSVHVEPAGLAPGTEYFYRFRAAGHLSPVGRTRTAPAAGTLPAALTMSFASCAHFEEGWYSVFRAMAADHPDLVLFLGDYLYEYPTGHSRVPIVRRYLGPAKGAHHLASYRRRYAQHRTDPDLRAAHAAAPWLVVLDDHELENNWAGSHPGLKGETAAQFKARKTAAFQAYYENMPLRRSSLPRGAAMSLHRRYSWGNLARFHLLDTRQFRDDQACGGGWQTDCRASHARNRTITGAVQERWLLDGLAKAGPVWDLIGQQVFFAQRDNDLRAKHHSTSTDSWDGYTASRDRITRGWVERKVRNPVVLTGDVHRHWVADLKTNYDDPRGKPVGTELVTTSVTSSGDGDEGRQSADYLRHNPHIRYYRNRRGYVRTRIEPGRLTADMRIVPKVTDRNAKAVTDRTFVVEDGRPGARPA